MEIKYPVYITSNSPSDFRYKNLRFVDGNHLTRANGTNMDIMEREFLQQLVADANEAAELKADYESLSSKIDDMVAARMSVAHGNYQKALAQADSDAFVEKQRADKLAEIIDGLVKTPKIDPLFAAAEDETRVTGSGEVLVFEQQP